MNTNMTDAERQEMAEQEAHDAIFAIDSMIGQLNTYKEWISAIPEGSKILRQAKALNEQMCAFKTILRAADENIARKIRLADRNYYH